MTDSPPVTWTAYRPSACTLGRLFQLLRPHGLPLGLALGPLLLGAHLLGFACLLQRAPLLRTRFTHFARLEDHQRADCLLAHPCVGAGEAEGPYAVGTDDDPGLLELPPVQEVGLGGSELGHLTEHPIAHAGHDQREQDLLDQLLAAI